eukprot:m.139550 g.139550  ORF g.139550 m.139550 type:complete len:50 (-) comp15950_c0_seq2:47-196(-)
MLVSLSQQRIIQQHVRATTSSNSTWGGEDHSAYHSMQVDHSTSQQHTTS